MNRLATAALASIFAFLVPLSATDGQEPSKVETYRLQLEADRERLYAMSREERHAYIRQYFEAPATREERRAAKAALELFRSEGEPPEDSSRQPLAGARDLEKPTRGSVATKVAGTSIQYDTGTVFGIAGVASQMLGNRFDSAVDSIGMCCVPVETTGTVTMATFDMINTFFGSAVFSIYSNIMGTAADQVTSMALPGIMTGLNTLTIGGMGTANVYMNGTFLAGIWQFDPTMTGLAIDTGSTGGQGFHGISLNDGAMGSMLTTVTTGGMGVNAIFRVQGNVVTPVELMDFTLEEGRDDE